MKKILLMITLICGYMGSMWGQISSISGNPNVVTGETWMYSLYFNSPLDADTNFIIKVEKGSFQYGKETEKVERIKKGVRRYDFFVTWGDTAADDAKVIAYKQGDLPSNIKTLKVKITGIPPKPQPEEPKDILKGPEFTLPGDTITYHYHINGSVGKEEDIFWYYNHDYLRRVSNKPADNFKTITFVVNYTDKDLQTRVQAVYNNTTSNSVNTTIKGMPFTITSLGEPIVNLGVNNLYKLNVPAKLKGEKTITWLAGNNMTLVSGQGTTNATFKSTGYGLGTVKTMVMYEGKSYTIENSVVEIVNPDAILITTDFSRFFAGNHYSAYIPNVLPGYKYTWSISGATIVSSNNNSVYFKVGNFTMDASVLITVTTQSGKRISKSIPVKGLGGGGGVYPEI